MHNLSLPVIDFENSEDIGSRATLPVRQDESQGDTVSKILQPISCHGPGI
jgi:hypothetical protein